MKKEISLYYKIFSFICDEKFLLSFASDDETCNIKISPIKINFIDTINFSNSLIIEAGIMLFINIFAYIMSDKSTKNI